MEQGRTTSYAGVGNPEYRSFDQRFLVGCDHYRISLSQNYDCLPPAILPTQLLTGKLRCRGSLHNHWQIRHGEDHWETVGVMLCSKRDCGIVRGDSTCR